MQQTMSPSTRLPPVPKPARSWAAISLAVVTHVLLGIFLFFGVRWQSKAPDAIQAELWSSVPQIAAPAATPTPPAPVEAPKPVVQPKVEEAPPPVEKPDIVIKVDPPKKVPKPKPVEPPPKPVAKPEPKPQTKPEVKAPPPTKPSQTFDTILAADSTPSNGKDPQTSGVRGDPTYEGLIRQKVLSNLRFPLPSDLSGNPEAEFKITQLPNGEVDSVRMTKSSGIPGFDAAVERAIQNSSPLPRRKDGSVDRNLTLVFHPKDSR